MSLEYLATLLPASNIVTQHGRMTELPWDSKNREAILRSNIIIYSASSFEDACGSVTSAISKGLKAQ